MSQAPSNAEAPNVLLQLELPAQRMEELRRLQAMGGFDSLKEMFSNSLTLLAWAVVQRQNGRLIASVNEGEQSWRELHMPFFDRVRGPDESNTGG